MGRLYNILHAIAQRACIETGTSGGWSWRKYADGTYEAWCKTTLTYAITTASGGMYFSGGHSITIPSEIGNTGIDFVSLTCPTDEGTFGKINAFNENNINAIGFGLMSSIARSTATARPHRFYVKGTWA